MSPSRPRAQPLLSLAALLLLAACEATTAPAGKTERPVGVQRITFESQDGARDFVGVVRARYENDLGFRVAGKIVTRAVNVGDRGHAGDVVARLDPQDLKLQVESAEAELAAATSNLAQAAADLERYTTLRGRGYASVADFDRKKAANDEAEGRLERRRRALDLARNQHGYADLRADADGVIPATLAEPGQVVAVGQAVARLAHHGEKEAGVALPQSRPCRPRHTRGGPPHRGEKEPGVPLPEPGLAAARKSRAVVRLWSDRDRAFDAQLRELSP